MPSCSAALLWTAISPPGGRLPGKPIGFVVSGPLRQLDNLRSILEGVYGAMQMRLAGFATDEDEDIDGGIAALAESLYFLAESGYAAPQQFPADHRYYKKHGWYDFPQKRIGARLGGLLMRSAMQIPAVRKNMQDNMKSNMILSYRKVVK